MTNNKLNDLLTYVSANSPFYKNWRENQGIELTLDKFKNIPFTTKEDLAKYNDEFLCVPRNQIKDFVTTSGTLGEPVSFYLTAADMDRLAENEWHSMKLIGATSGDVFQLMVTMDKLFMAGLAYFLGIKKLNAAMVRIGPGSPQSQLEALIKYRSTVLIAIPSFIVKLIETAKERGIDLNTTAVKSILCIGEPIRNADFSLNELGKRICTDWKVQLYSTYASTEMATAFTECKAGQGGHLNPDLLHLEVLDENGQEVADGELGEVVVTPLGIEGLPLLRYKTGDLCQVHYSPCSCGLNTPRLGPVIGRKQHMIKYKGTTLFPAAIFDVLATENVDLYQLEVSRDGFGNDDLSIYLSDVYENQQQLTHLKSAFKSRLRVTPNFKFLPTATLQSKVFPQEKRKPEKVVFV